MILMRIKGSRILSNTWKQELTVTETGVESETLVVGRRVRKSISFNQIASVNAVNGILKSAIEVVNTGGSDNIFIKALKKREAKNAKILIDSKVIESKSKANPSPSIETDIIGKIRKLAELKMEGIITESEFEEKKTALLLKL